MNQSANASKETKKDRRLAAREAMKQQREAELKKKKRIRNIVIAVAIALALLIVGGIGFAIYKSNEKPVISEASSDFSKVEYLHFGATKDKPVVDVYVDFLCPYCAMFAESQMDQLQKMAADKEIDLRIHPRMMLEQYSNPPGYSSRAANAAVAVYKQDPNKYFAFEKLLFENQPEEGSAGLNDEQLADLAKKAGADETALKEIKDGVHVPWLKSKVEAEAYKSTSGTPTVKINGKIWEGRPDDAAALKQAIESASK